MRGSYGVVVDQTGSGNIGSLDSSNNSRRWDEA